MAKAEINMKVNIDAEQAMKVAKELATTLEKANSLADELAEKMKHLEIEIER